MLSPFGNYHFPNRLILASKGNRVELPSIYCATACKTTIQSVAFPPLDLFNPAKRFGHQDSTVLLLSERTAVLLILFK